jgi:hypothetical protein
MNELYQFCRFNETRKVKILSGNPNGEIIASRAIRVSQNTAKIETRRDSWNIQSWFDLLT